VPQSCTLSMAFEDGSLYPVYSGFFIICSPDAAARKRFRLLGSRGAGLPMIRMEGQSGECFPVASESGLQPDGVHPTSGT